MASIGLTPISLVDATLVIDSDEYATAIDRVEFLPDVDIEWLPAPFNTGAGTPLFKGVTWQCYLGFAQDTSAGSLARYLLEHAGQVKVIEFTSGLGGDPITATVTIVPGGLGGSPGGVLTAEAVLPVHGDPVVTDTLES